MQILSAGQMNYQSLGKFGESLQEDTKLYDLRSLFGLVADNHEDKAKLENILDAQEDTAKVAAENGMNAEDMDIDSIDQVPDTEPEVAAGGLVGKVCRKRQLYSVQQH